MFKLTTKKISYAFFLTAALMQINLASASIVAHNNPKCSHYYETQCIDKDMIETDAGGINFELIKTYSDNKAVSQKVESISIENHTVTLSNGSVWKVSNVDAIRGWEKYKHLVITQNHAKLSTHKFALVNAELGLAEPITLMTPPVPNHKDVLFIKKVDPTHDIVKLNNDNEYIVHTRDHGLLNKFNINSPILVGVNTTDQDNSNPYILIDVSLNSLGYVRATSNPLNK